MALRAEMNSPGADSSRLPAPMRCALQPVEREVVEQVDALRRTDQRSSRWTGSDGAAMIAGLHGPRAHDGIG